MRNAVYHRRMFTSTKLLALLYHAQVFLRALKQLDNFAREIDDLEAEVMEDESFNEYV